MHLGHAAHALYVWGVAGVLGGRVVLRMEDHDRQRSRPAFEAALLEDLAWLGFEPANGLGAPPCEFRQSDCDAAYATALERLATGGRVYRCTCSRKDLASASEASPDGERVYPGTCREARRPESAAHGLRLAWPVGAPPESFDDGLLGPQRQRPERQCGDVLLRDRLGQWTYQFAVAVDDIRHGIDFVVRGEDLLPSTGRQRRLARMLGRDGPVRYFHHPLVRDSSGSKLSKAGRAPAVRALRRAGMDASSVLGEAALAVGLQPEARRVEPRDAADLVGRRHAGVDRAAPDPTLPALDC